MPTPRKILVFRSGLLGDTLVAVPALWALRRSFPEAWIVYLWQSTGSATHISAPQVLDGSGVVDEFWRIRAHGSWFTRALDAIRCWWRVRRFRFDAAIVLEASHWRSRRTRFLKLAGVPLVIDPPGTQAKVYRLPDGRLPTVPHIADELLALIARLGAPAVAAGAGDVSLPRTSAEERAVDEWLAQHGAGRADQLVAIAPGSNMPAKRWPVTRFVETVTSLSRRRRIFPVVLGGADDRALGATIIAACGRGAVAAGELGVREGIELLSRCALFLGNDTGTMHMAAAAGVPCVAVFAAVDMPGRWSPYGPAHVVFRADVSCAGCLLRECVVEGMRCLAEIQPAAVIDACERLLTGAVTRATIREDATRSRLLSSNQSRSA